MEIETLEKANGLNKKRKEFEQALNCFQWEEEYGGGSTNPSLIIEFDGADGREQLALPMNLSDVLIEFLKAEIIKGRDLAISEFKEL